MPEQSSILHHIRRNKTVFILIGVGLFLIELEIFALAAMHSGREARLQVLNKKGELLYEADGTQLTEFNKYYFEKNFGPLGNYPIRLVTSEKPFPFRAWFAAAIGVPVGAILLFGFAVKAYLALAYPEAGNHPKSRDSAPDESESRFERVVRRVSQFNIFVIGTLTFLTAVTVWMLPNLLQKAGAAGVAAVIKYKWVCLGGAGVFLALVVWVIYLRYLLARKTIESQVELDKFRLQLEMAPEARQTILLPHEKSQASGAPPLVEFERDPGSQSETDGKQT